MQCLSEDKTSLFIIEMMVLGFTKSLFVTFRHVAWWYQAIKSIKTALRKSKTSRFCNLCCKYKLKGNWGKMITNETFELKKRNKKLLITNGWIYFDLRVFSINSNFTITVRYREHLTKDFIHNTSWIQNKFEMFTFLILRLMLSHIMQCIEWTFSNLKFYTCSASKFEILDTNFVTIVIFYIPMHNQSRIMWYRIICYWLVAIAMNPSTAPSTQYCII